MFHDVINKALKDELAEVRKQGRDEALKECHIDLISQVMGLLIADIKQILD